MKIRKLNVCGADGSQWAGIPYLPTVTTADLQSGSDTGDSGNRKGNSVWNQVLDNTQGWLQTIFGGVGGIMQAKTGNYPTTTVDNTPKVLAISAVAAIVLIVIILIIFKK